MNKYLYVIVSLFFNLNFTAFGALDTTEENSSFPYQKKQNIYQENKLNKFEEIYMANHYQDALKSMTTKKRSKFIQDARNGNAFSQCIVAIVYEKSIGVPRNLVKSTYWLEKAAYNGDPEAQFRLGQYYEEGLIKRNFIKKIKKFFKIRKEPCLRFYWYEQAALQEHAAAQYTVGIIYAGWRHWGDINIDFDKAKYWLEKAKINGDIDASKALDQLPKQYEIWCELI